MEQLLALLAALYMLLTAGEIEESGLKVQVQDKEEVQVEEQEEYTVWTEEQPVQIKEKVQETVIASEETIEEIQTDAESEVTEEAEESDALAHYACYVVRLKDIMKFPDNYWGLWSSINITEHNQFAIEDINGDGVEELLVKYNSAAADREEEFQYIDIYSYNDLKNTIMAQEVEFYTDGTIVDIYTSEYRRSDTYIYENFELTNHVMILDQNKMEYSIELDFPEEEDTDGDGIVHIWYEEPNNIPVEPQYISEEEYQERLSAIRRGKEQIDIFWYQITERNIEDIIYNQLYKESHAWVSGKDGWPYAYKYFLDNKWNLCDLLMEQNEAGMYGYIQGFYLHDIDKDGVPELFVSKAFSSTYIYTYTDEGLELRSVIPYDSFSDEIIGYDMRDGQVYIYYADAGTSPVRETGIYKVLLPEEIFTEEMRSFDFGRESIYGATYGEMDLDNGEYMTIEWEDAIMQDDATGEKKEAFLEMVDNFAPFVFHEITDENLEKYICKDYQAVQEQKELNQYKEEIRSEYEEFLQMNYLVPEHTPIISSLYQKVYFCMDEMTVYGMN